MEALIFFLVFIAYFSALFLYFLNYETQKEIYYSVARRLVLFGFVLHFSFLGVIFFGQTRQLPIVTLSQYLDSVSFFMILACFIVGERSKTRFLMLFSLPIVLLFCFFAILLDHYGNGIHFDAHSPRLLWIHTGLLLSAFTSFIISVSSALMYLLQSRQLKSRHPGKIFLKLPALNVLDRLHVISLFWGVLMFSLGILSGFFLVQGERGLVQLIQDPKVILSFVTCVLYWVILSLRMSSMRRGQKIAASTVIIFVLLFVTIMSSVYAPSVFHRV